jgi:ABC-2 type transport system ATP-binding protein
VVEALSHRYRGARRPALDRVSFRIEPGERVGLLGPNGAGKTTLMRILCGYLPVGDGSGPRVEVGGLDVTTHSLAVRKKVGYLTEQVPLYQELRAREHLGYRAALKGVPRRRRAAEVERVAELTGLGSELDRPVFKLSRGYRQRVGVADALLGDPPLLVLDEPTVGLDPNQVQAVRSVLRGVGGTQTLMLSSHILAEVEVLCDRVLILSHGRVVTDEPVERALRAGHAIASWDSDRDGVRAVIDAAWARLAPTATRVEPELRADGSVIHAKIPCPEGIDAEALCVALGRESARMGVAVLRLEAGRRRLEERFARVTAATPGEEQP